MNYHDLTDKQGEVLDFIRTCIRENDLPPTRAEIASRFAWKSVNTAQLYLQLLRDKGRIELEPRISRGIRLCG
jgi:repressor LexA